VFREPNRPRCHYQIGARLHMEGWKLPVRTVGEVGLRKHHPRPDALATFGLGTVSVSRGSFRCTGANETLMPFVP
jgi:hypothetical protein